MHTICMLNVYEHTSMCAKVSRFDPALSPDPCHDHDPVYFNGGIVKKVFYTRLNP
jgi:hypothetical protein